MTALYGSLTLTIESRCAGLGRAARQDDGVAFAIIWNPAD